MSTSPRHEELFAGLIAYMDISEHTVKGFDPAVTLSLCNDELGLLTNWMFRADMISVMLMEKRCFDVIYQRNDDAISMLSFEGRRESEASLLIKDSYDEYPYDGDIPKSLLSLISALAVTDSLKIDRDRRQVEILPFTGFFKLPEHGQPMAFPSLLAIEGYMLNQMGQIVKHNMGMTLQPGMGLSR